MLVRFRAFSMFQSISEQSSPPEFWKKKRKKRVWGRAGVESLVCVGEHGGGGILLHTEI